MVGAEELEFCVVVFSAVALVMGIAIGLAWATYAHETPTLASQADYLAKSRKLNAERATPAEHNAITVRRRGVL